VQDYCTPFSYQFKSNKAKVHYSLAAVCSRLSVSLENIVAIGSRNDDADMLSLVSTNGGCALAMSNIAQAGIRKTEFIGDSSDEDCIIQWIEQNMLNKD
jgi:hydroxymethylpyrimidine pyrophosphatase-like HAD family hydrolase